MTDFNLAVARLFNFYDDVLPAKTSQTIEAGMVNKLMGQPGNQLSLEQAKAAIHDLVHVQQSYTVLGQRLLQDTRPSETP